MAEPAPYGGTTHISVVDAAGNAAALTCSTGSGSGVIVPGTGIHLNNMLGEYDLASGGTPMPGRRLTSMMSPTVVLGADGRPRLVVGSAGSVRLRGAIMQTIVNVVTHGLPVAEAIDRPRVHVDEPHVHCEGGFDPGTLDAARGARLRRRPLAAPQPVLRRHERRSRCCPTARWPRPATRAAAAPASSSVSQAQSEPEP